MTPREWLHQVLTGDETLMAMLPGGVHQAESFDEEEAPAAMDKPLLVHRGGVTESLLRAEGRPLGIGWPMTLWVHDEPGDYTKIDEVLERLRTTLGAVVAPPGERMFRFQWLEDSQDLVDDAMGTIVRNTRWQLVHR